MLPFLFRLTDALRGGFQHGLLNGVNYRIGILARGQDHFQFIPKPLAGSGEIEVVALDGETIGKRNASPGRMPESVQLPVSNNNMKPELNDFRLLR
jgi:hypothetical protein